MLHFARLAVWGSWYHELLLSSFFYLEQQLQFIYFRHCVKYYNHINNYTTTQAHFSCKKLLGYAAYIVTYIFRLFSCLVSPNLSFNCWLASCVVSRVSVVTWCQPFILIYLLQELITFQLPYQPQNSKGVPVVVRGKKGFDDYSLKIYKKTQTKFSV